MTGSATPWRDRACAAVIRDGSILMVRHRHDGREYWTLPGGGVEVGETARDAALRELAEETRLSGEPITMLYEYRHRNRDGYDVTETCFLMDVPPSQLPELGSDPELHGAARMLVDLAWRPVRELGDDHQVSRVLAALDPAAGEVGVLSPPNS